MATNQTAAADIQSSNDGISCAPVVAKKTRVSGSVKGKTPLQQPWRKTLDFSNRARLRESLIADITRYKPLDGLFPDSVEFPYVNILLLGPIGAGKSSTYNTIMSIFMNKIFRPAPSGQSTTSYTFKLRKYTVMNKKKEVPNFRIWDMRGIEEQHLMSDENMRFVLNGRIPDKFSLDPSGTLDAQLPGFNQDPKHFETIHCVVVVVDISSVEALDKDDFTFRNIRDLQNVMYGLDVPMFGIATKIDARCTYTMNDPLNAFRSQEIRTCVQKISDLLGLPMHSIFPVKNYEEEVELDAGVDILMLLALKSILDQCDAFLVNRYKHIVDKASVIAAITQENERLHTEVKSLREDANDLQEKIKEIQLNIELYNETSAADTDQITNRIEQLKEQIARKAGEKDILGQMIEQATRDIEQKQQKLKSLPGPITPQVQQEMHASQEPATGMITKKTKCTPITVQVYFKHENKTGVEDELANKVSAHLKTEGDVDVVYHHVASIDDISEDNPLLVLCAASSRLGTDVDNAVRGLKLNKKTLIIICHYKEQNALPNQRSDLVLTGEYTAKVAAIHDLAYLGDKGFYECDLNKDSLNNIVKFLLGFASSGN